MPSNVPPGGLRPTAGFTAGLNDAFNDDALRSFQRRLAGATALRFLASRDARGDGIDRFGIEVARSRFYSVVKSGPPLYLVCHLGPNGEMADVDLTYR